MDSARLARAATFVVLVYGLSGQSVPRPEFAAPSIKPNRGSTIYMGVRQLSRGTVIIENMPLRPLIAVAYKRRERWFEISGGTRWMDSDGYDVNAKAGRDATNEQMYPMLQRLLEDRFQLKMHRETQELPVFALTAAKSGLKPPNSKPGSCFDGPPGTEPPPAPGKPIVAPCGNILLSLAPTGLRISGGQTSMDRLAASLSGVLGRTVVDRTGYPGTFDVDLEFTPDDTLSGIPARGMPGSLPTPPPSGDAAGPSLSVALQEKLGLKLNAAKEPVTVFVVDQVARPTAN